MNVQKSSSELPCILARF